MIPANVSCAGVTKLPIPHVMWSPFRYSVFRLIWPDQSERVERSPSCKHILHETYEIIPLENRSHLNLIVLAEGRLTTAKGKQR